MNTKRRLSLFMGLIALQTLLLGDKISRAFFFGPYKILDFSIFFRA